MPGKGNPSKLKPFVKGDPRINRKGQPRKIPELDTLLADTISDIEWGKIIAALKTQALKPTNTTGMRAAEILLNRGYGMPKQKTEIEYTGEPIPIFLDPDGKKL